MFHQSLVSAVHKRQHVHATEVLGLSIGWLHSSLLQHLTAAAAVLCVCVCRDGQLASRLEQAAQDVKAAYSECPSYDVVRGMGRADWIA
jgi:hypothetical protein